MINFTIKTETKLTDITITVRKVMGTLRPEHMYVPTNGLMCKWLHELLDKP